MSDEILVIEDETEDDVFGELQTLEDDVVEEDSVDDEGADDIPSEDDHDIVTNKDGTRTITLKYPVTLKLRATDKTVTKKSYDSITFRRCSGSDMKVLGKLDNDFEIMFALLERLSVGVPNAVFDKMDAIDLEGCQLTVEPFLPKSPKTGNKF